MRKCSVCGRRFRLLAKNRYEVMKNPVGFNVLTQGTMYYNAFDCPHCGCQNIVGVLEKAIVKDVEKQPQKSKIRCSCTDSEITKSFIDDVESVKDLLPRAESEEIK